MEKGRRKKVRYVQKMPKTKTFSPRGTAGRPDEVLLAIDQFEAIKLADYQGYNQSEGAVAMGISRASFGRIVRAGRRIIADALVNGKIIKIGIANVQVGVKQRNIPKKCDIIDDLNVEVTARENILKYVSFDLKSQNNK
ncbi:MAG: putative DNA-binding protein (UPF0251 family) [Candidatus Omnitrophota bacterium]|jgi:predicted DNA-binding protein (UPF0251 family)